MKVGMICPYSFDEPGGVQIHALELCQELQRRGHEVSLLGPGKIRGSLPDFVELGGASIPIRYNGSVARLSFGPRTVRRIRRWITEQDLDLLHIHEPNSPSYSMLSLTQVEGPIVATYHASADQSRLLKLALPFLRPLLDRIQGGIAVSEQARKWQVENLSGDPVLIPNGVDTSLYKNAVALDDKAPGRVRMMFLGRFEEPRKGLHVLLEAFPEIVKRVPEVELVIAGGGSVEELESRLDSLGLTHSQRAGTAASVRILGRVSDVVKAQALASSDIYVAPNTGGESFGIVLVEAMASGTAVLASDIPAFAAVGQQGHSARLFRNEDAQSLAEQAVDLLNDAQERHALAARGVLRSADFDWSTVATQVEQVYNTVATRGRKVTLS
ncbi:glycosyltransferase family 4 protein [Corynebacterium sp. 320]|uniref:Glycosyltransferase family 4 protein n=1 Tax=Corynebacterium zhongnanshanii TaxID=2768834 RepID=A0ABQ6VG82_9CORY|nr:MULTISPECIES: glycosyltransferase family 4 protein [Corynebacterium]KAB1503729.1 glycosyltransferase family 4 protein [Corynebacterium sp. 320]KAB1553171.1 glycosyltransferase family 4 protein [Corynebacterium sp. 321]KAB1553611.1 glycosyltransferase family 4 protein [Corynebacterium sp. 319]KAB3523421.1 glycosyltransferase family 4 protein [Corynebacterium zhongnanshanii]KAB3527865.1 glycosyltransferase family 4 protein [Corynebacterium sp. 250]